MKTSLARTLTLGTMLMTFTLTSCSGPVGYGGAYGYGGSTGTSTVTGALIGAGAGGIIGNQRHRGLEGAAIGGILGALAGSMMGGGQRGYPPPQQGYYSQPGYNQQGYGGQGYNQNQNYYGQGYGSQGNLPPPPPPQGNQQAPGFGFTQPNSFYPTNGYANGIGPQPGNNPYAFGTWQ